jgi:galactitol PTS system EIIA component
MPLQNDPEKFDISKDLILVKDPSDTSEAILGKIAGLLEKKGHVKGSFRQAVIEREAHFPTGIQTKVTGVAVPHADIEHVNTPAIAVASLAKPVNFKAMNDPKMDVNVEIVIAFVVKEHHAQAKALEKTFGLLSKEDALRKILAAIRVEDIYQVLLDL